MFTGIGLNKAYDKGRKSGTLAVTEQGVSFSDGAQKVLLPFQGLKIELGGAGNRYVYFNHNEFLEWTLYTDELHILDEPQLASKVELKGAIKGIKTKRKLFWTGASVLAGCAVALLVAVFLFRGAIVRTVAEAVPVTWEQEISEDMLDAALAGKLLVEDPWLDGELRNLTQPLVDAVENEDFAFNFYIVEDQSLNAFALPGGAIVLHSGLIQHAESEEEVCGVLAHEICHVTERHHVRGLVNQLGVFVLVRAMLGDGAGIIGDLTALGASLESLKYSRDMESEADAKGWELMERAQLNPNGMIAFFQKLHEEHGGMDDLDFLSTHPGSNERVKALKQKKHAEHSYKQLDIDWGLFKQKLNEYLNAKNE